MTIALERPCTSIRLRDGELAEEFVSLKIFEVVKFSGATGTDPRARRDSYRHAKLLSRSLPPVSSGPQQFRQMPWRSDAAEVSAAAEAASLVVLLVTALLAGALGPAFAGFASGPGSVLASAVLA